MTIHSFNILVIVWIGFAVVLFPVIFMIPAPYGRHTRKNWGPMIDNRLGWILMEAPALVVFAWLTFTEKNYEHAVILIFSLLWIIHYTNRVIIFPLRIRTKGKKMPLAIMLFALIFNLVNGFINGYWFGNLAVYSDFWLTDIRFILGLGIFIAGFIMNHYHDHLLINLRKTSSGGYHIPTGGLFRYVSCPNFLGEITEWAGFALMTWCLPTLSFFIWTMVNLIPRALDHHKWYKKTFPDYPPQRKAILPEIL